MTNNLNFHNLSNHKSYLKNPIVIGTIILTFSGFLTKIIGFFYRVFLSQIIKEEGLGIIGLLSPVIVLAHSIYSSGLQSSITKFVASAKNDPSKNPISYLFSGMIISLLLSLTLTYVVFTSAHIIARNIINEPRCTPLLQIIALSFPPAAIHSCINGFFYGYKKTSIPAFSMIIEQLTRVITVYILFKATISVGANVSLSFVCIGTLMGEFVSAFFSCLMLTIKSKSLHTTTPKLISLSKSMSLCSLAYPLTLNRICINLICSVETIKLPSKLIESGLTSSEALSLYGIFTGMALPLVMFPSAITGAASSLLLPSVSEAQASGNKSRIRKTIYTTIFVCFILGVFFMIVFVFSADFISDFLFKKPVAAPQIRALSYVCPFLYLSGTLTSILHGLGKTGITFIFNILSITLRLCFVLFLVPYTGFSGYIYGIICSQILFDLLIILALRHYLIYN